MTLRRLILSVEFALLFVGVPIAFATRSLPVPIIPAMLGIAMVCTIYLAADRTFSLRRSLNVDRLRYHLRPILGTFALLAPLMAALLWSLAPDAMFVLPREKTVLWGAIMCLYPLLSVLPQTVIWRVFLLHRYRSLIGTGWPAVVAATVCFSFAHIYFLNAVALLVTAVGGLMFVLSYIRSGSLVVTAMEHALYGCWAFTVGYGRFLYGGSPDAGG